jgi:hypothetical protein
MTITGHDCESQRSLRKIRDLILVRTPRNLFVRVTASGDFKHALQTIRSCDKSKVDSRLGIEFIEKVIC